MTTEWKDITDEMMMRGCQATQREELERQIMSSLVPKSEREHWACREIESLRQQVAELTLSSDTYFAERNSARDAWRRVSKERDQLREHVTLLRDVVGHVAGMRFSIVTTKMCEAALAATEPKP